MMMIRLTLIGSYIHTYICVSYDVLCMNDRIGGFDINLCDIWNQSHHQLMSHWYTLLDSKGDAAGSLLIDIAIIAHTNASPLPSSSTSSIANNNNISTSSNNTTINGISDEEVDQSIADAAKVDTDSLLMYQVFHFILHQPVVTP